MATIFKTPRRAEDLSLFARHLAGAMAARVPMPALLRAYAGDCEGGDFAEAAAALADKAEAGVELSAAMESFPKLFPPAFRRLVGLGEQGGTLAGVMAQWADHMEESLKVYESFRRAAIYPAIVATIFLFDLAFIIRRLLPKFVSIYADLGLEYRGVLIEGAGPGGIIGTLQWIGLGLGAALGVCALCMVATLAGLWLSGFTTGRLQLMLPLVGPILRRAETARFASNLALLLENRLPLDESLALLAESSENGYVRAAIRDFHERCRAGETLGDLVASQPLFPRGMAAMIAGAESHGGLADTLRALGRHYAARASHGLAVMRELMEPMMIVAIGALLGAVIIGVYAPMFSIARQVGAF